MHKCTQRCRRERAHLQPCSALRRLCLAERTTVVTITSRPHRRSSVAMTPILNIPTRKCGTLQRKCAWLEFAIVVIYMNMGRFSSKRTHEASFLKKNSMHNHWCAPTRLVNTVCVFANAPNLPEQPQSQRTCR